MTRCNILWNWCLRRWWSLTKIAQTVSVDKPLKETADVDISEMMKDIREVEEGLDTI